MAVRRTIPAVMSLLLVLILIPATALAMTITYKSTTKVITPNWEKVPGAKHYSVYDTGSNELPILLKSKLVARKDKAKTTGTTRFIIFASTRSMQGAK